MEICSIGHNLRMIRFAKNYTQKQVADALGLDDSTIANYENNKRKFKLKTIEKFAAIYEVSIERIIGDNEAPLR